MAYRLSSGEEPVSRQLQRILLEQTDSAIAHLSEATSQTRDTAIHEARKDIKKLRALLRLVAHQLSKSAFTEENHRFRDIGRQLSQVRDAHAMIESVANLPAAALPTRSRNAFLKRLQAQKASLYRALDVEKILSSVVADLKVARPKIELLTLVGQGYDAIEPGILSMYRRGRKALKRAQKTCSSDDLHNLRKRVKDHGYQIRLFQIFDIDFIQQRQALVRDLETVLGEAHNLHVLRSTILEGKTSEKVSATFVLRETELNAEALVLAEGLYRWKTRQFKRQLSELRQLSAKPLPTDSKIPHKPPAQELTLGRPLSGESGGSSVVPSALLAQVIFCN